MITPILPVKACMFDAYGTLFDVHSAVNRHRDRVGENAAAFSACWRAKQLEYTWLRSLMNRYADFWQVTRESLEFACDLYGLSDEALKETLLDTYLVLETYPEVAGVLHDLRGRGFRLGILSNGTPAMLAAAVNRAGLADVFAAMLSVDEVGIYKPDPRAYDLACRHLNLDPHEIAFVSSNAWDGVGAAVFGFRVIWLNRFKQKPERLPASADFEISDFSQIFDLLTRRV